ncbi:MAG: DUF4349 domain-containing protein [Planctomycetota bacterium]
MRLIAQSVDASAPLQIEPALGGFELDEATTTDADISTRWIVQNATIEIEVMHVAEKALLLRNWVGQSGGYVSSTEILDVDGGVKRGELVLRVPSPRMEETLAEVRRHADRVVKEQIEAVDRSDQAIDLAARLRNLELAEQEMRELMSSVRQATRSTSELLRVHTEVVKLREQVEQHRGRLDTLEDRVQMAMIKLSLLPTDAASGPVVAGWSFGAQWESAWRVLLWLLQGVGTALAYAVTVGLPVAILVGIPVGLTRRLLRSPTASAKA